MSKGLPERFIVDVNMHGFEDDEIFFQTDDASLVVCLVLDIYMFIYTATLCLYLVTD